MTLNLVELGHRHRGSIHAHCEFVFRQSIHRIQILEKSGRYSAAVKIIFGKLSNDAQFRGQSVSAGSGCIGNVNRAIARAGNIRPGNPRVQSNNAGQRHNVRSEGFRHIGRFLENGFIFISRNMFNLCRNVVCIRSVGILGGCGGGPNLHQILLQNGVRNGSV